jgi:hypothetical protein
MILATRMLNLVSGVVTMATGVYVMVMFQAVIADELRLAIALASVGYFAVQFYLQVVRRLKSTSVVTAGSGRSQFSS